MQKLKAVILVGGPGTRLQPLTDNLPKSMVPVLNKPVMEHTIAYLKQFGIEDIILTLNYLPDAIRDSLGDGSRYGVNLIYCMEEEPLGTAGAVKNTEEFLDGNSLVVLNGDIFTDLDIGAMLAFHRENRAKATIALNWVDDPSAFGVVEMDDSGRVRAFIEKPPREEATTNWINAGTYILEPDVLRHIPVNEHYMFERGLFPGLLKMGEPVYGFKHHDYWLDMGTLGMYFKLSMDMAESRFRSPAVAEPTGNGIRCHPETAIPPGAELTGAVVIDKDCRIGNNVRINGPVIIGSGCKLEDCVSINRSILWRDISVGAGTAIDRSILCDGVSIPGKQEIQDSVITTEKTAPLSANNR
ncbi:MAG: NDP-sugar synthase [Dehalococcoidales bacterium]|nr:NDP-sugar synthase [Dehalococcoidales bacterium]